MSTSNGVMWAILTRWRPDRDTIIISGADTVDLATWFDRHPG